VVVVPDAAAHEMYTRLFAKFKQQYPALKQAGAFET
jgi:hypothetical protein